MCLLPKGQLNDFFNGYLPQNISQEKKTSKNNKLCSLPRVFWSINFYFLLVAKQFYTFLKHYQTDLPMVPFLAKDLESLIGGLMRRCIRSSVLEEAGTIL